MAGQTVSAMAPHRAKQNWRYWEMRFDPTSVIRVRTEGGISTMMEEKPQQVPITMPREHTHEPAPINVTSLKAGYVES